MSAGRCAGCGETNRSHRVVERHMIKCPQYAELYRTHPEQALGAEAEYVRWSEQERDVEKADAKAERVRVAVSNESEARLRMDRRWTKPEPLLDEVD